MKRKKGIQFPHLTKEIQQLQQHKPGVGGGFFNAPPIKCYHYSSFIVAHNKLTHSP